MAHQKMSKTGHPYEVRYLTCQELGGNPLVAHFVAVYKNYDSWPPIFTYSTLEVPKRELRPGKVQDGKFNINLEGEQFTSAVWVNGFKQKEIVIGDPYSQLESRELDLQHCDFFFDHLQCGDISVGAKDLGFSCFPAIFKQKVLEGTIKVTGVFEWHLRRNVNATGTEDKYTRQNVYRPGSIDLSRSDLSLLKQVVVDAENNKKMQELIRKLRAELSRGKFVSESMVEEWCTLLELEGVDVRKIIEGETMHKDYEPAFFRAIKAEHDANHPIFYSSDGFLFYVNGHYVWELPEYGAATYLFLDAELKGSDLAALLGGVTRKQILEDDATKAVLHYVRRSIHPKDADNEAYFDRWLQEVCQKL
jgi:hypothetical protein